MLNLFNDISRFVQELTSLYGSKHIARDTQLAIEDLERWRDGGNSYTPEDEWKLFGFCCKHRDTYLLKKYTDDPPGIFLDPVEFGLWTPPLGAELEHPQLQLPNRP